ncbi:MAG: ABC transporter substrate-binding protein, partial [Planctomycetes bacterium]|nr:ABC transporter substrate-binding protein [Planctomycetota bacterium]
MVFTKMRYATLAIVASLAFTMNSQSALAQKKALTVAEPVHGIGYLPLYIAMRNGYFAEENLDVKKITTEGGAAHINAVITGQAFAFIGGPEHNARAKLQGADLRAVVNVVDRGNVYLVAKKGVAMKPGQSIADFVKGKEIATGFFGGTPNSITRYLLNQWKLDARRD